MNLNIADSAVLHALFVGCAITGTAVIAGWLGRKFVFRALLKLASRTESRVDDIILAALERPFVFWSFLLGLYLTRGAVKMPPAWSVAVGRGILILFVFSLASFAAKITGALIKQYESALGRRMQLTSLSQNVVSLLLFLAAGLIVLNILGVSVAPIVTAFGVGGIAIGLAMQDTLSNLFSGIYILMSRKLNVGDYIMLNSGEEGDILDIGWRASTLRTLQNNIVIVPNLKISQAIVTNFTTQDSQLAVLVPLSVPYGTDLEKAEKAVFETAEMIQKNSPGAVKSFIPLVRFHTFGENGVGLTVVLRAGSFKDQQIVKHEFVKAVSARFAKDGIEIPFPTRTVIMRPDKAGGRAEKT